MAYRFEHDESIADGVRRIADEQLRKALDELDAPPRDAVVEVVHGVRKRCKKLRGLIRLVRPAMGKQYRRANVLIRDAARELSSLRDAHALLGTFDDLVAASPAPASAGALEAVREGLAARAEAATDAVTGDDERVQRARALLREAHERVSRWRIGDDLDDVAAGLAKTYGRGRRGLARAFDDPTDANLHEWRKRAKYTWYHVRLLQDAAPSVLGPLTERFHDLSDAIGDDHDLAVLTGVLRAAPDEFGGTGAVREAQLLIDGQRADLQRRALRLGARLYVEKPAAFGARMVGYHAAWMAHGPELPTGEIAALAPAAADEEDEQEGPEASAEPEPPVEQDEPVVPEEPMEQVEPVVPEEPVELDEPVEQVEPVGAAATDGQAPAADAGDDEAVPDDDADAAGDLDALPRARLYRLAQEHDVPGRSRMSRTELVAALRAAGARGNA